MKELINKHWNYIFSEDGGDFYIDVVCGTVAVYDIKIKLNEEEKASYLVQGESYLDGLAGDIRTWPSNFLPRRIS